MTILRNAFTVLANLIRGPLVPLDAESPKPDRILRIDCANQIDTGEGIRPCPSRIAKHGRCVLCASSEWTPAGYTSFDVRLRRRRRAQMKGGAA